MGGVSGGAKFSPPGRRDGKLQMSAPGTQCRCDTSSPSEMTGPTGSHRNGELKGHDDDFPDCGGASGPVKLFKKSEKFSENEPSVRKKRRTSMWPSWAASPRMLTALPLFSPHNTLKDRLWPRTSAVPTLLFFNLRGLICRVCFPITSLGTLLAWVRGGQASR